MAITFRDAFKGMADTIPQLLNNYFQYMQLSLDAQRTQAYTGYMEQQGEESKARVKESDIRIRQGEFDLQAAKDSLPLELRAKEARATVEEIMLNLKKAEEQGLNRQPGGSAGYFESKFANEAKQALLGIEARQAEIYKNQDERKFYLLGQENQLLERDKIRLSLIAGAMAMAKNEPAMNKVWDSLNKQFPKGNFTAMDIMNEMTTQDVGFASPQMKEFAVNYWQTVSNLVAQTTMNKNALRQTWINTAIDPDKANDRFRESLGVKRGTPMADIIKAVDINLDAYSSGTGDILSQIVRSTNAYARANGLSELKMPGGGASGEWDEDNSPTSGISPYFKPNAGVAPISLFDYGVGAARAVGGTFTDMGTGVNNMLERGRNYVAPLRKKAGMGLGLGAVGAVNTYKNIYER